MTQTCETCGRSWGDRAMFCGACGALLDRPLPRRGGSDDRPASWWRRPIVGAGVAVAAVVGIVAAVPTLSIERTDPVEDAAIGVPEADELQDAPAGTRPRRQVDPPEVTCTRDGVDVDCVTWSRGLVPPMDNSPDGGNRWPVGFGDHVLLVGDDQLEVADAQSGTRLWRQDVERGVHPVGGTEDLLVLTGPGTSVLDVATGETRWSMSTFGRHVYGDVVHEEVVYTGTESDADAWGLAARDPRDGEILWTWPSEWGDLFVQRLDEDRLLVSGDGHGMAVLDPRTGRERSRSDHQTDGWILGVVDDMVVTVTNPRQDPSEPNRAGDPGATMAGMDVADGTVRWRQEVRSSEGWFELVDGVVLAPSSRHLTALDATTGAVVWEIETTHREQVAPRRFIGLGSPPTPNVPGPGVVITVDQDARVLRARDVHTGEVAWAREMEATPWHATVRGDDTVVQTDSGIHVVETTTGQELVQVGSADLQVTSTDPFVVFHPVSGYVSRLDLPVGPDG